MYTSRDPEFGERTKFGEKVICSLYTVSDRSGESQYACHTSV